MIKFILSFHLPFLLFLVLRILSLNVVKAEAPVLTPEQSKYFLQTLVQITEGCVIQDSFKLLQEKNVPLEYCSLPNNTLGVYHTTSQFNPETLQHETKERKVCLKKITNTIQSDENLMWVLIHEARHAQQEILYGQQNLETRLEKLLRKEFFCPIFLEKHPLPIDFTQEPYSNILAQMQEQYLNEKMFYELDADYIAAEGMYCLQDRISKKNLTYGFREFYKVYQKTSGNQQDFYDFFVKDAERIEGWRQGYRTEFQESVESWYQYFLKNYKHPRFLTHICQ